jgi:hypothetical protein
MRRLLMKTGWCVPFFLALVNCILAMRYLSPRVRSPRNCRTSSCIASRLRATPHLRASHSWWGRFNSSILSGAAGQRCIGASVGCISARWHSELPSRLPLTLHAGFGPISGAGFLTLDIVWLLTTAIALRWAIKLWFDLHRRWMLRSYALAAAAISLRIMLPLSAVVGLPTAILRSSEVHRSRAGRFQDRNRLPLLP